MMRVLGKPFVTDFREPEPPLHHTEGVLHFRPHARLRPVRRAFFLGEWTVSTPLVVREVQGVRGVLGDLVLLARVGRVTPDSRFPAVQQIADHHRVVHIRCGRYDAVDHLRLSVDADVRLHAGGFQDSWRRFH